MSLSQHPSAFFIQRVLRGLLPPLAVAGLMLSVFAGAARYSRSPVFSYDTWIKWDSGHYLAIANQGYELLNCPQDSGYGPTQWCGNAGWFPGYPYLLRALHVMTGQPTIRLAILVSQAFTFIDLWLAWTLFLRRRHPAVLALCAFGPGTYYFLVGFPISMGVCFILIALWASREGRSRLVWLSGAIAGFTYPSGVWLTAALAAELALKLFRRERVTKGAWLAAAGPSMGFAGVLLVHHLTVGHWNAFFLTQAKYEHAIHNPLAVLWHRSLYLWEWARGWQIGLQSAIAAILVLGASIGLAVSARRRTADRGDFTLGVYSLVYWLIPLVTAGLSPYRAEALLMPVTVAARRLPTVVQVALLAAAIAVWTVMATQFIQGVLV